MIGGSGGGSASCIVGGHRRALCHPVWTSRLAGLRRADVAQLVAHHLAKVRVAGSNPVVRSEEPRVPSGLPGSNSTERSEAFGGVAQWESASLTRKRSLFQSQYRPPLMKAPWPVRTGGLRRVRGSRPPPL